MPGPLGPLGPIGSLGLPGLLGLHVLSRHMGLLGFLNVEGLLGDFPPLHYVYFVQLVALY